MTGYLLFVCLSYLFGSVPFGLIFSRLKGVDPRKTGSGNIGATNVMRAAGKVYGFLTLFCDVLKGFLPVHLAKHMGFPDFVVVAAGLASFIGHILPITLRFKGGKGVATALGVFLSLNVHASLVAVAIFMVVVMIWKYVSLGSLLASLSFPFLLWVFNESKTTIGITVLIVVIIFFRHKDNIERLLSGRENRLRF